MTYLEAFFGDDSPLISANNSLIISIVGERIIWKLFTVTIHLCINK